MTDSSQTNQGAQKAVGFRLGLMMFLQFFLWGAWWVTLAPYMASDHVGMAGLIFLAYLSQPIAAMVSPFFLGLVADRYFSSERVLAALHLLGGVLLLFVPYFGELPSGPSAVGFIGLIILHMLCYMPTIGLTNAVAFNTMTDAEKQFPVIRVFGTIGWIVSNLVVGVFFAWILGTGETSVKPEHTTWPFYLAAGTAIVMGLYSLTLPHTPPRMKGQKARLGEILGLDAVQRLSSRSFWVFIISSLLICIPLAAYYTYANQFAVDASMGRKILGWEFSATAWMSTGQMTEVLFMLLMPLGFRWLGVKWMLVTGMAAWALRYALFAMGAPDEVFWIIWAGILLHGICYDFFFVTGMIYVERISSPEIRAQAQGFLVQMTLGVGMFIGMIFTGSILFNNMVAGIEDHAEKMQAYQTFWLIPAIVAGVVMIGFGILFKETGRSGATGEEQAPSESTGGAQSADTD